MITATSNFTTALTPWRGQTGKPLYLVTIAGYSKAFTNYKSGVVGQVDWLASIDDLSTSVNDLDGGADLMSLAFNVMDRNGGITADFPSFTFEGKLVTLKMGLPGLAQSDFVTLFTGFVDTVASANANQEYYFTCNDVSSVLSRVVYAYGDDGFAIDSDHPKTLLAHPLDLLISIAGQSGLNFIPDWDNNLGTWTGDALLVYSVIGGQRSGGTFTYTGTGAASSFHFVKSGIFNVVPGEQYILSCYIDASHVTSIAGGLPNIDIYDPTITTFYQGIGQAIGTAGFVQIPWTCPAGVTQVRAIVDTDNCTVANTQPLIFSDMQLSLANVGSGLFIDVNKIRTYRDGVFSGIQFQFNLTQSMAASDFIKNQIMKPLGGYLWVNSLGQVTTNFFAPLATPAPVATLGPNSWLSIPEAEQLDVVNQVQYQFDKDDAGSNSTGNYLAVDTEVYGPSLAKYSTVFGEQTVQADGLRSGLQGFFVARMAARMIFGRYGLKNLKFDQSAPDSLWTTCLLEPGDVVAVTHPKVPDRSTGVVGVTNKLFEVLNRTFKFSNATMNLTMIDASFLSVFGLFQIAPDAQTNYNLLANPSAFDTASWTKDGGSTITANNVADPDGVLTGDTLTQGAGPFGDFATIYQKLVGDATAAGWQFTIELKVAAGIAVVQIEVGDYSLHGTSKNVTVTTQWQPFFVALNPATMSNTGFIAGGVLTQNTQAAGFQLQMCRAGLFNPVTNTTYMFLCDNTDKYTNGDAAHALG